MNLAPLVYQFLSAATGGAKDEQFDIHALPGIFGSVTGFPSHFAAGLPERGRKWHISLCYKLIVTTLNTGDTYYTIFRYLNDRE